MTHDDIVVVICVQQKELSDCSPISDLVCILSIRLNSKKVTLHLLEKQANLSRKFALLSMLATPGLRAAPIDYS
jgi:hypothetical protein